MRVAFVAGTLGRGGAERQLFYILRALVQAGARPSLYCLTRGETWEIPIRDIGVPVKWVGESPKRLVRLVTLARNIRGTGAQLIQSQHFYTNLYAAYAARALRTRDAGALRNDCTSEVAGSRMLGGHGLRFPRVLIANSRGAMNKAREYGVPESRIHHLPNVVELGSFRCHRGERKGKPVRILAVGRLERQKRFDRLLHILAALKKRGRTYEARIVGEGARRNELETLERDLGLQGTSSMFHGETGDIRAQYEWADILVQTSDYEGTPNVVLEAMASGLPVVATAAGDTSEICPAGEAGEVVDLRDDERFLECLDQLTSNEDLRLRFGKTGQEVVRRRFSSELLPSLLAALYERILVGAG